MIQKEDKMNKKLKFAINKPKQEKPLKTKINKPKKKNEQKPES